MNVILFKTGAWVCFALGILLAWNQLTYLPGQPEWISALIWVVIMWTAWFFLLRAALNREKRGD